MTPRPLRYVLVTDGSSDACLVHPIDWLLRSFGWYEIEGRWADLRALAELGTSLSARIGLALEYYPADLIFIHRDAEREPLDRRIEEIEAALESIAHTCEHVCVVPVRMTEAWLLHDADAIRAASGNPNGRAPLELPALKHLEDRADPKEILKTALLTASEARGRVRKQKVRDFGRMRHRVAELIEDYGPLRALPAFSRLEDDLEVTLEALGA